jgi:NAD(P)-dependent dehydrogenase (short-subunit alcohol dehydrogenase family)/rhamnose utilization protein RhaD (predicted bifunctional aldolase and dehydrogenase)
MAKGLDTHLAELVEISHLFGRDPELVLAGGGNTSYKTPELLFIKASGVALAEIELESFVRLDRRRLATLLQKSYPEDPSAREADVLADLMAAREPGQEGMRPSVESSLHDLLPDPYVVHTHATVVNGLTCGRDGEQTAARLFGDRILWVRTVNPGYTLAITVRAAVEDYKGRRGRAPDILLLQNHGLIVSGGDRAEIREKTDFVLATLRRELREVPASADAPADRERAAALAPALRMLLWREHPASILTFRNDALIASFLASDGSFGEVSTALSPDHIVYCNPEPLFLPRRESPAEQYELAARSIEGYVERNGFAPKIVAVEGLGAFAWGPNRKSADAAMAVFQDALKVLVCCRSFGGALPLPPEQVRFISNWEVEIYRKKVSAAVGAKPGRVLGKIALVTGAAQGFGLGLTEALLAEGANVVLGDLNEGLAREQATALVQRFGSGRAQALRVDVGGEDSVRDMVVATVLAYGGLDIFVSNAGVLRAGGLEDLPTEAFELVNRINYTGYYLGCKHASRPMKIQRRFAPGYAMDIIQINSKSGLSGSNRNFAYSGSKFGSIGLTESFALELVEHGIKVNSICPGNFFDGPLWSDPKTGLFVQYLNAGKVKGARTVEDVRRYYEERVPMGRGCAVEDVARAMFYLIEQLYETGQALPVTGGQSMLK